MSSIEDLKWDDEGLIPAVVQDAATGEVLTVAYMNRESLTRTRETGETFFYSRSRKTLWHKGETSGNFQKVESVTADCDGDALVVRVHPSGPACHTGSRTCFFQEVEGFAVPDQGNIGSILTELERLVASRRLERPEGSYTARLFDSGRKRVLQKVGEEAVETVLAGMGDDRSELIRESSDLLFHLLVAWNEMGISTRQIAEELRLRRK